MTFKPQSTRLNQNISQALLRLENWSLNPWRRYSLFLITLLTGFFLGSSVGAINGVLALMDPVGALVIVLILELMIRLRRVPASAKPLTISIQIIDMVRIGLLYGLLTEGFKLF